MNFWKRKYIQAKFAKKIINVYEFLKHILSNLRANGTISEFIVNSQDRWQIQSDFTVTKSREFTICIANSVHNFFFVNSG